jgi:predicted Fe-Mo cluster-binding NifX family protein
VKIAVASEDGISISHHFGRSRCFLVFEVEDKKVVGRSVRDNTFTAHAKGECQEGAEHNHHHGHGAIVEALKDCQAVLCYGMGWRAAEELKQNGIQAFLVPSEMSPEDAVNKHLAGDLGGAGSFCRCQH